MKICVTAEDIRACPDDPIAHALERAFGGDWATGRFSAHNEKNEKICLPSIAQDWLAEYDFTLTGWEFEFEADIRRTT